MAAAFIITVRILSFWSVAGAKVASVFTISMMFIISVPSTCLNVFFNFPLDIFSNFVTTQDRKNPNILMAYSYLKAFRFPDDMQVQIRCVVAVCRDECRKTICSGADTLSGRNASKTSSSDEDEQVLTTTVASATTRSANASHGIFGQTVKQRGAFEQPSDKSQFRRRRQLDNAAAGTLPLRHVFNVISPEDIQNLRNSSVVFVDSTIPANSVCVNQAMLTLLLCFLMAVVLAVSVALTLMCLRNKALRRSKLIEMYPQ
ncbi:hypothetical protein RvY_08242-1 [Ramazzottius varieornatus]|uniref:ZP domain-containing protein n=1 Tax=Ramazzottius varieornatus TaxID=947166 RepID=A0A1D1V548_RAMVA|nr:hypothetical protein RvY_08242-1 [Ramazzottius varieornatus]